MSNKSTHYVLVHLGRALQTSKPQPRREEEIAVLLGEHA